MDGLELDRIVCGDALAMLRGLGDASVDMIFTDIPYGVHEAEWDTVPDLPVLMTEFKRVIKPRRAIIMTAQQPLTTDLINAARDWFKYLWVWDKINSTDIFNARNRPMRRHEDVLVFSSGTTANKSHNKMLYNPQGLRDINILNGSGYGRRNPSEDNIIKRRKSWNLKWRMRQTGFPESIIVFYEHHTGHINPNQKPVALLEYLIRTYSNEGDIILDPFAGSGTTAVAARNTGRHFYACDISPEYVAAATLRLQNTNPADDSVLPDGSKQLSLLKWASLD